MQDPNSSDQPPLAPPLPPVSAPAPVPAPQGDATGGLIPYKNGPALIAYYLGVFSIIPCVGIPLGAAAIVLGILGLKKAARQPEVRGQVHAWVGIVLGGLFGLAYLAVLLWAFAVANIYRPARM